MPYPGISSFVNFLKLHMRSRRDILKEDIQRQLDEVFEIPELNSLDSKSEFVHLTDDDKQVTLTSKTAWVNASRNRVISSDSVESLVIAGTGNRCKIPASASTKVLLMGFHNFLHAEDSVEEICISGGFRNTVVTGCNAGDVKLVMNCITEVKIRGNAGHITIYGSSNRISVSGDVKSITVIGFCNSVKVRGSCLGQIRIGEEANEEREPAWTSVESSNQFVRSGDRIVATTGALKGGKVSARYWRRGTPIPGLNRIVIGWSARALKIPVRSFWNTVACSGTIETIDLGGSINSVNCLDYVSLRNNGFLNSVSATGGTDDASMLFRNQWTIMENMFVVMMPVLLFLLLVFICCLALLAVLHYNFPQQ